MSHIVLFHSALGLRPAVRAFAATLEAAGHTVTTPDLFDGHVFDSLKDGVAMRDRLGIPELTKRAEEAVKELAVDVVYAGFSMGAASAQHLALTRPGARGAILMHAALPTTWFGVEQWPREIPVQVHTSKNDPWVDMAVVDKFRTDGADVFLYDGAGHLFADAADAAHDATSAALMTTRVTTFLASPASRSHSH